MSDEYDHEAMIRNRVALFAPSGPPLAGRLQAGMAITEQECPEIFQAVGMPPDFSRPAPLFPWLQDIDSRQAEAFSMLMRMEETAFVWAVRGGYGIMRWLDKVDLGSVSCPGPVVTGFSDITVLHAALNSRGIRTLHAPMLCTLEHTSYESRTALWDCLCSGKLPELAGQHTFGSGYEVRGRLSGGNLCCLSHLVGTPWEPLWNSTILVLEDTGESLYRIDRMLTHLLQSRRLSMVAGIAVGEFSHTGDSDSMLDALLQERLGGLGIPVISGMPVGHGENNMPLLMGADYLLDPLGCRLVPAEGLRGIASV